MKKLLVRFWKEEEGLATIEIVIILAVLVAVALIFRKAIFSFVTNIIDSIFPEGREDDVTEGLGG